MKPVGQTERTGGRIAWTCTAGADRSRLTGLNEPKRPAEKRLAFQPAFLRGTGAGPRFLSLFPERAGIERARGVLLSAVRFCRGDSIGGTVARF